MLIPFVAMFMVCCRNKKTETEILPLDTMKVVMLDFFAADEWHNVVIVNDTAARKMRNNFKMYQQVLDIHKINKGQFDSSLNYYIEHPDKMKVLIDTINSYVGKQKEKTLQILKK